MTELTILSEYGSLMLRGTPTCVCPTKLPNRCFPTKAVAAWQALDDAGHVRLVEQYLREAGNWKDITSLDRSPRRICSDPLYAVIGHSTGPTPKETNDG